MPENYHRSPDGTWRYCNATTRACPVKGDHVSSTSMNRDLTTSELTLLGQGNTPRAIKVAPTEVSSEYCPECNHYQPRGYILDKALDELTVPCLNCGARCDFDEYGVDLRASEQHLLTDEQVYATHWFHVTQHEDWFEWASTTQGDEFGYSGSKGTPLVHLGSHEAAMERLRYLSSLLGRSDEDYYLHELRIKPEVPLAKGLFEDLNRWPDFEDDKILTDGAAYAVKGVTRYLNRYEGAGTVSLLANGRAFEQVTHVAVPHSVDY